MIEEDMKNEYYKQRSYSNIFVNSKQRFGVDYMIDEDTTNALVI
jgi:hypothetical protein